MSGPQSPLAVLPDAVTKAAVDAEPQTASHREIIENLIQLTTDFLSMTGRDTLFGKGDHNPDPYKPSLGNLYNRLQDGCIPPSPVELHCDSKRTDRIRKRTSKSLLERPLRDYEDIYYALLALTQEMYSILRMRINNGFNSFQDSIYDGGHQIYQVVDFLISSWTMLNTPAVAKAFDDVIRKASFKKTQKRLKDDLKEGLYTVEDVTDLLRDLEDPVTYHTIPGLNWVGDWSSAMINIMLEQKYRRMFSFDRKERAKKSREGAIRKREAKLAAERELKKRLSAERMQREELLKAQLQEEALQRRAQLRTSPLHHEQQQSEEHKMAARASLVSSYMNNLRHKASPHAKRLMHDTVYNNPPPVYRGSPSPTAYPSSTSPYGYSATAPLQQSMLSGNMAHNDRSALSVPEALHGFHRGGPAQSNTKEQASQQGFGTSGSIGNDVFARSPSQRGFASSMQNGYTSLVTPRDFVGPARTGQHGHGSPQAQLEYSGSVNQSGYTTQTGQGGYAGSRIHHGNQETVPPVTARAGPVSEQLVHVPSTRDQITMDFHSGTHNGQSENLSGLVSAKHFANFGTSSGLQPSGDDAAPQAFHVEVAGAEIGKEQGGGNGTEFNVEMGMEDDRV